MNAAWYQREITIPSEWAGRRIALCVEYLNSYAAVYVDGKKAGETPLSRRRTRSDGRLPAGRQASLSMLVMAMPLKAVMLSYSDTLRPAKSEAQ